MPTIASLDTALNEDFDSLAGTGTTGTALPAGWAIAETGTAANTSYGVGTGSANTGNTYSFGATGSTERALGSLLSGSLSPSFGASFTNTTGQAITSLDVAYFGEQWRLGNTGRSDRLDFQISFDATSLTTGTWTDVNALDFASPVTTGAIGALDGNANATLVSSTINLTTAVGAGATFWIRWVDADATPGADDGLAVDNFSLTAHGAAVAIPGTLGIADASATEGDAGTSAIVFTVNRTGGSDGAVSATWTATLPGGAGGADAADLAPGQVLTGSVEFADGQTSATVTLQVAGDTVFEPSESFTVTLSAPTGGAALGDASATGTIANDDAPPPAPPANVWINELHYDNVGTDSGEAIEIAGRAGTDLTGYQLVLYNGGSTATEAANAVVYNTRVLSGLIDDEGQGYGAVSFAYPVNGLQNGSPDAIALVAPDGTVLQFLSYEGVVTAASGPAAGLTSTDIGVEEGGSAVASESLQVAGNGAVGDDFAWQDPASSSFGALNSGQTIIGDDDTGLVSIRDTQAREGDAGTTMLEFTVRRAGGLGQAASVDYAVVLDGSADAADLAPGAVLSGTVAFAEGEASRTISLAIQGDLVGEPNETLSIVLSNPVGNIAIIDGTAAGTIVNDDPLALTIPEIQGASHRSAYVGQTVIASGVVTALDSDGFWFQDAVGDGNAATSDGVFVFTGAAPGVAVGQLLSVQGTVAELQFEGGLPRTEIVSSQVNVLASGVALPAATVIGQGGLLPPTATIEDDGFTSFDPASDGMDFWESLEGMLVTIDTPQAVSNSNGFGETGVVASLGVGATGMNDRGGITIAGGDFNPEKIQIDNTDAAPGLIPTLTVGDQLADVTGVVNYAFNTYEVLVTAPVTVTQQHTLVKEVTALEGDAAHLTIATYNLENLGADELSADPAVADRFDVLAGDIVYNLRAPDVLAVQEIQDADGPGNGANLSGQATADALIRAIADAGGPQYVYVEIAPDTAGSTGGEPGGNIRNGYLYNPDRVDYLEGSAALITDAAFNGSRKPLTATFAFNGESFTAINVHLTSRLGSEPLWGDSQPAANGGEAARMAQVGAIAAYVNDALATDPDLEFAVLGDFNGFYFEPALQQLSAAGVFTNLATLLPPEERYSYLFEGNAQLIDNIYVTNGLLAEASYDAVHLNSQVTVHATDHDPQLARLQFNTAPTGLTLADAAIDENAPAGTVVGTLVGTDSPGDTLTYALLDDAGGLFTVDAATGEVRSTQPFDYETQSSYAIVAQVSDQGGKAFSQGFAITVADLNEAPVAGDDGAAVREDAKTANLWSTLLANDHDPDAGAQLKITAVDTSATLGTVEFDAATKTLRYHADDDAFDALAPGQTRTDRFAYTVVDQFGVSDTAVVTVTVTGVADGVTRNGGRGIDILVGSGGEDRLNGGQGADLLTADGGHDVLIGGQGIDLLFGGDGNDLLVGGQGADVLSGGDGRDGFAFGKSGGAAVVTDFDPSRDRIELYDGIGVGGMIQRDVNWDGKVDLTLLFTKGGGSAVLLGVGANASLSIFTTSERPSEDFHQIDYTMSGGHLLPTLVDLPA